MKTIVIISFVLFAGIKLQAQAFKTYADTANYLISQIENKKSQYIRKPFSVLHDSLKIKPVLVMPDFIWGSENKANFGKELCFDFNYESDFSKEHYIIIDFDTPPSYTAIYPMFYPKEDRAPIGNIINLYKPLIVKDIIVKDYSEDDPVDPNVMQQQE